MAQTKIEWCDRSWNWMSGCSPISEGCQNCWARRMANRLTGRYGYPQKDPFKVTIHWEKFIEPMSWKKHQYVFACSMGDFCHKDVPSEAIQIFFDRAAFFDQHTYLALTKRPQRLADEIEEWKDYCGQIGLPFPTPNLWLGVSVENQPTADERISELLKIPAAKRFVSVEPMLGAVNLQSDILGDTLCRCGGCMEHLKNNPNRWQAQRIDWVICGGETGPGARPMHPDWVRSLRDQCQAARVPFFFKSRGEWGLHTKRLGGGLFLKPDGMLGCQGDWWNGDAQAMCKIGKKKAGRLLDGRTWEERPDGKMHLD